MVRLSVIIPAYNRAHLISETLRSLLMQTRPADEIIVVDDGSTDNTAEIAAAFGSPIRVIRQSNGGPAAARNTGFRASTGKFIHFFDSDDLAAPNKQEVQLAALESSGADIAYGPWIKGRFVGDQFLPSNQVLQQKGLPHGNNRVKSLLTSWSVVPHAALFRRSIVERAGGFPEDLFGTEDQFMFLSCLLAGAKVVHTPFTIEFYREGNDGKITESKSGAARRIREWGKFILKARKACLQNQTDPARWFGFRQRAWQAYDDLAGFGEGNEDLQNGLKDIFGGTQFVCLYRWRCQLDNWRGGLQIRLTGRRGASVFKMGPLNAEQVRQLGHLGYRLKSSGIH